ncbi:MAG: hypothetical protein ACE5FN_12080, partial [Leptospirillia bacterium]
MTPSIRKTGFQTRVVMAILLIGMVSVALGLASVYFFGRASLEKSIGTTYKELAIITAKNLDTEIAHHLKEAHTIAATNDIIRVISESNGSYAGSGTKEIKNQLAEVERRWASDAGVDAYLHALLTNRATDYLKRLSQPQPKVPVHLQILVTDIKGAAVAATKRPRHDDL